MNTPTVIWNVVLTLALATPLLADGWSEGPALTVPRTAPSVSMTPCGDIYVIGGINEDGPLVSAEVLRFEAGSYASTWQQIAPLNTRRYFAACAQVNGVVYVIGGVNADGDLASVERLDTTAEAPQWELLPYTISVARHGLAAVVDGWGRIWVLGGQTGSTSYSVTEVFDPHRPAAGWVAGPDMLSEHYKHGAIVLDGSEILVVGGSANGMHIDSVERLDLCSNSGWQRYTPVDAPVSESDMSVVGGDDRIYIVAGWLPGYSTRCLRYDPAEGTSGSWETFDSVNLQRNNIGLVLGKDKAIYVIGGDSGFAATSSVERLTPQCGRADLDADGDVDFAELLEVLSKWGPCP